MLLLTFGLLVTVSFWVGAPGAESAAMRTRNEGNGAPVRLAKRLMLQLPEACMGPAMPCVHAYDEMWPPRQGATEEQSCLAHKNLYQCVADVVVDCAGQAESDKWRNGVAIWNC